MIACRCPDDSGLPDPGKAGYSAETWDERFQAILMMWKLCEDMLETGCSWKPSPSALPVDFSCIHLPECSQVFYTLRSDQLLRKSSSTQLHPLW